MSYWRKFILVVLLALSLPIQSFATVSMQCAGAAVPHAEEAPHTMSTEQGARGNHGDHESRAASCAAGSRFEPSKRHRRTAPISAPASR